MEKAFSVFALVVVCVLGGCYVEPVGEGVALVKLNSPYHDGIIAIDGMSLPDLGPGTSLRMAVRVTPGEHLFVLSVRRYKVSRVKLIVPGPGEYELCAIPEKGGTVNDFVFGLVHVGEPGNPRNRTASDNVKAGRLAESVSCDLKIINVSDSSIVASASGKTSSDKLDDLAKGLAKKLEDDTAVKGKTIAVVSFRSRSGTAQARVVTDELADKVGGALHETRWFDVKDRIDLRAVLSEKDLDSAGIVNNEAVRKKLAGVRYIVIGGVTVTESGRQPSDGP